MKFLRTLLCLVLFCSSVVAGLSLFCNRVSEKEVLYEAVGKIDMTQLVKEELGVQYPILVKIVEMEESKTILASYSQGLIDYLSDNSVRVNIPEEELEALYSSIADKLIDDYPSLAFLPKDKCVEFLLGVLDFNMMMPDYQKMAQRIPQKAIDYFDKVKDTNVLYISLGVMGVSLLLLLVIFRRKAWMRAAFAFLLGGAIFALAGQFRQQILVRFDFGEYTYVVPFLEDLMKQFLLLSNGYIIIATVLSGIRIILGKEKSKDAYE